MVAGALPREEGRGSCCVVVCVVCTDSASVDGCRSGEVGSSGLLLFFNFCSLSLMRGMLVVLSMGGECDIDGLFGGIEVLGSGREATCILLVFFCPLLST